jgi:hypothetical protein
MRPSKLASRVYAVGGRREIYVYADIDGAFAATELRAEAGCYAEPAPDAIRIFLFGGMRAGGIPVEIPPDASLVIDAGVVCLKSRGSLLFGEWYGRARSVSAPSDGLSVIVFPGVGSLNRDFVSRYVFRPILDEMLAGRGYVPLHAAGVSARTGGWIVAGTAGAGKTSLACGLVRRGCGFLADDRLPLRNDGDAGIRMYSFPEYVRRVPPGPGPKRLVTPSGSVSGSFPVAGAILIDDGAGRKETSVRRLGKAEAMARLMQTVSANIGPESRSRAFEVIAALCERAGVYLIGHHGDEQGRLNAAVELLSG